MSAVSVPSLAFVDGEGRGFEDPIAGEVGYGDVVAGEDMPASVAGEMLTV